MHNIALCASSKHTSTRSLFHLTSVGHKNWMFHCMTHDKNGPNEKLILNTLQRVAVHITIFLYTVTYHLISYILHWWHTDEFGVFQTKDEKIRHLCVSVVWIKIDGHKIGIVGADQYQRFKQCKQEIFRLTRTCSQEPRAKKTKHLRITRTWLSSKYYDVLYYVINNGIVLLSFKIERNLLSRRIMVKENATQIS